MKPILGVALASLLCSSAGGCNFNEDAKADEAARMMPAASTSATAPATSSTVSLTKASATPVQRAPTVVRVEQPPTTEQARVARAALAHVFRQAAADTGDANIDYFVAMIDLNDDSRPDMIVHIDDYRVCGQWGCQGYAILATPTGFRREAIQLGVCFQIGFTVLPTATKGMRDLKYDWGGGADRPSITTRWNGTSYGGGCLDTN